MNGKDLYTVDYKNGTATLFDSGTANFEIIELRDTIAELTELAAAYRFHLKLHPGNSDITAALADVIDDLNKYTWHLKLATA